MVKLHRCPATVGIDASNGAAKAIDPPGIAVVAGELHAVTGPQFHRLRLEHFGFASTPLPGMPVKRTSVATFEGNAPALGIDSGNCEALAPAHALGGIVAAEPDNIADGIACCLARLGTGEAFRFKRVKPHGDCRQLAALGQFCADHAGEPVAAFARWLDDQRSRTLCWRQGQIVPGHRSKALVRRSAFDYLAAATFERGQSLARMAFNRGHDGFAGVGIGLPDHLGKLRGRHACLLQLGKGSACTDRSQLLDVADQNKPGSGLVGAGHEFGHVVRRKHRGFIDNPDGIFA